jgi:uroporphyrinogen decarboxylase
MGTAMGPVAEAETRDGQALLSQALKGRTTPRPPIWLMRQAGRYLPEYQALRRRVPDFLEFCYSPPLTVEATLQPVRRFDLDAAIVFSDILVIADALGRRVTFVEGRGPVLDPLAPGDVVEDLRVSQFHTHLHPVYETLERVRSLLDPDVTLIGFAGAPWTIALYMIEGRGGSDAERVRTWASDDPTTFQRLIDVLVDATAVYLERQIASGADAVQIFDSWAGLLGESQFRRWVIQPTREIVTRLRRTAPHVPIIGFPRGAGALYADYVRETGVNAVSVDQLVPASWAKRELQSLCTVQGNLDPFLLVSGGPGLDEEVRRLLTVLADGPYVFNLGHGILPRTPVDNVARIVELVRGWRVNEAT